MSSGNRIKVQWEFDIETDEELQSRLGLTEGEVAAMLGDEEDAQKLHSLCCGETGVPEWVDLDLFFDDPRAVEEEQITDALSDEYGWLIQTWEWQYV